MNGRNEQCWCGSGKKWKKCHYPQEGKAKGETLQERYRRQYDILLKNEEQIAGITKACEVTAKILQSLCEAAVEGVTTEELDKLSRSLHAEEGAIPAPLNYGRPPFPKSICTSINEVICHGIPDARPLVNGDILNIDVSAIVNGYYGDCSKMVSIGTISIEKQLVIDVAYEALMAAIEKLRPGLPLYKIGEAISDYAERRGCSVVHQFVGHGVGLRFHEGPQIFHSRNDLRTELVPGMIFTIEPMINAGTPLAVIDKSNHWTARTADGRASAQWEHTLLITESGYRILTPWKR